MFNMKKRKQPYHHGDLHQTLITAAKEIVHTSGLASLSMRKLAEKTNVSRAAPYHHFKDKNELLCALAEDGFLQQDALIDKVLVSSDESDPAKRFESLILAFLHFASENKEQYDLMYGASIWKNGTPTESLTKVSKDSFRLWLREIEKLQQHGVLKQNVSAPRLAQVAWATLHGLCHLSNDRIYVDPKDIDDMGRAAVRLLLAQ
jgi:AcrR family transcriptional regulator